MPLPSRGVLWLALASFVLEWSPSLYGSAGYFIDEFYYLVCADRLAFGYVDHPPFSILVLRGLRVLAGDALPIVRLVPALAGAATVFLTGVIALRLGAGSFGQLLAAAAVVAAPVYQTMFGFYSMNALAVLIWAGCFLILIEIERRDEPRLWLAFGALAGIGLLNKHTIALLAVALGVGLILTPARRHLASRWLWVGLGTAWLLALPNVLWQVSEGWPSLAFYVGQDAKNIPTSPFGVLMGQVVAMNPLSMPIWVGGLTFLLGTERGRPYRHLGWSFAVLLALMLVAGKSRPDRIAAAYTVLFAAGATLLEAGLTGAKARRRGGYAR